MVVAAKQRGGAEQEEKIAVMRIESRDDTGALVEHRLAVGHDEACERGEGKTEMEPVIEGQSRQQGDDGGFRSEHAQRRSRRRLRFEDRQEAGAEEGEQSRRLQRAAARQQCAVAEQDEQDRDRGSNAQREHDPSLLRDRSGERFGERHSTARLGGRRGLRHEEGERRAEHCAERDGHAIELHRGPGCFN